MTFIMHIFQVFYSYLLTLLYKVSLVVVCLSVCVLSLGKKLTRQEGQKHFLALFGLKIFKFQSILVGFQSKKLKCHNINVLFD